MQARKISVALIGSSEKIYDFITALKLENVKGLKHEGRTWEETSVPIVSKTDKSWACFTVKVNDIDYVIYPRSNVNFDEYLKYFKQQNDYTAENKKTGNGFQNPGPFLWPNDKVILCDVPEQNKKTAKEYCTKANIPVIDYLAGDPRKYLAENGKPARQTLFGSPTLCKRDINECNFTSQPEFR